MKYSNELKVGAAILIAAVIFFLGVRYFQDIPLFRGSYELYTTFEEAGGLLQGNPVRVNGVGVGTIQEVRLDAEANNVRVRFQVDTQLKVPEGTYAEIDGLAALGGVNLSLQLGPSSNPAIEEGGYVPGRTSDFLGDLVDRGPQLVSRADSLFMAARGTFDGAETLLNDPDAELRQALAAVRNSAAALNDLLRTERAQVSRVMANLQDVSGDLSTFTEERGDSLNVAVDNLNQVLSRLDRNLNALETTTASLDQVIAKINRGEGTLGLLVNDPSLYHKMDSAITNLNQLLQSFEQNPGRYLNEMRLVDIF